MTATHFRCLPPPPPHSGEASSATPRRVAAAKSLSPQPPPGLRMAAHARSPPRAATSKSIARQWYQAPASWSTRSTDEEEPRVISPRLRASFEQPASFDYPRPSHGLDDPKEQAATSDSLATAGEGDSADCAGPAAAQQIPELLPRRLFRVHRRASWSWPSSRYGGPNRFRRGADEDERLYGDNGASEGRALNPVEASTPTAGGEMPASNRLVCRFFLASS